MTDSERSYVTDKDVEQLLVAVTLETPTTDQRREFIDLLNGMIEREVKKVEDAFRECPDIDIEHQIPV